MSASIRSSHSAVRFLNVSDVGVTASKPEFSPIVAGRSVAPGGISSGICCLPLKFSVFYDDIMHPEVTNWDEP
jgi:hypothetical protein